MIEPDERPGWEVKILHIDGVAVRAGDRVLAGVAGGLGTHLGINAWWFRLAFIILAFFGGFGNLFLTGISLDSLSGTIPESVFMTFQMTFAIITPALIVGSIVDRMKFSTLLVFMAIWLVVVYAPITHWVWGGGFLGDDGGGIGEDLQGIERTDIDHHLEGLTQ